MENVTGHEEVEEDESEDQVTRAIVWPARYISEMKNSLCGYG